MRNLSCGSSRGMRPASWIAVWGLVGCVGSPAWADTVGNADGDGAKDAGVSAQSDYVGGAGGQANVSIPFTVPPGVGDAAPSFRLVYQGGGESSVGWGWSVATGYPMRVSRSTRFGVPGYDDATDEYEWGGERLLRVDASDPDRWAYRARVNDYARLGFVSEGGVARHHWVVALPDGTVLTYGRRAEVALEVGWAPAYAWLLSRVEDRFGNALVFEYTDAWDNPLLSRIVYTVNDGLHYRQAVELGYALRPGDVVRDYRFGGEVRLAHRLQQVVMRTGYVNAASPGQEVRRYDLCYAGDRDCRGVPAPEGVSPHLVSVQESAARVDGSRLRVPAWRLGYGHAPGHVWGVEPQSVPTGVREAFVAYGDVYQTGEQRSYGRGLRAGDVNGDGLLDLLVGYRHESEIGSTVEVRRSVYVNEGGTYRHVAGWEVPEVFVRHREPGRVFDEGVRLMDVNGDGRVDLVVARDNERLIYENDGRGWTYSSAWQLPAGVKFVVTGANGERFDYGTRVADVNGDGYPDLLVGHPGQRAVYLNDRVSTWQWAGPGQWALPLDFVERSGDAYHPRGVSALDVNGDGLADLVRTFDGVREIYVNTGRSWHKGGWSLPADLPVTEYCDRANKTTTGGGVVWSDFNGDGYVDIAWRIEVEGRPDLQRLYLNDRVSGFASVDRFELQPTARRSSLRDACPTGVIPVHDYATVFGDVDGDGALDQLVGVQVHQGAGHAVQLYRGLSGGRGSITRVQQPTGGQVRFQYGYVSGRGRDGAMPMIKEVVAAVELDGGTEEAPVVRQTYTYENGFYDSAARRFIGFSKVRQTHADGAYQEDLYHTHTAAGQTDWGRAGRRYRSERFNARGQIIARADQTYAVSQDALGVYTAQRRAEEHFAYAEDDPAQVKRRRVTYGYDAYGNVNAVQESDWSDGGGAYGIKRSTCAVFGVRDTPGRYLVRYPLRQDVYAGAVDCAAGSATPLASHVSCYDSQACGMAPVRGAVTEQKTTDHRLAALSGKSGTVTVRRTHDAYGNVTYETRGRTASARGADGRRHTVEVGEHVDWSGNAFLFPHTTSAGLGAERHACVRGATCLRAVSTYDLGLGVVTSARDANGQETRHAYDALGRRVKTFLPGDAADDPSVVVTDYVLDRVPNYVRTLTRLDDVTVRVTRAYTDGLGRTLGTVSGAAGDFILSGYRRHDDRGRVQANYQAFAVTGEGFLRTPLPARGCATQAQHGAYCTETFYRSERPVEHVRPGGAVTRTYHGPDYTIETDARGVQTYKRSDAFGSLQAVITDYAHPGAETYTETRHAYDPLGRLTAMRDPRGLVTEYFFDAWGRLRGVNTPEGTEARRHGYEQWVDHDEDGNRVGVWHGPDVVQSAFDALNRVVVERVSDDGGARWTEDTRRTYDDPARAFSQGRVTHIERRGATGTEITYAYDRHGRATTVEYDYTKLAPALGAVHVAHRYDRSGRLVGVQDPRGRWLEYHLDVHDRLVGPSAGDAVVYRNGTTPTAVATGVEYTPQGQVEAWHYRHGLSERYQYTARGWLERVTAGPLAGTRYTYEANGNISHIHDAHGVVTHDYDPLDRLKTAAGPHYTQQYGYDKSGNITGVTARLAALPGRAALAAQDFRYAGNSNRYAPASRVAARGAKSQTEFVYDVHGNLVRYRASPGSALHEVRYDPRGRLVRHVRDGTDVTEVFHDGLGRKVARTLPSGAREVYVYGPNGDPRHVARRNMEDPYPGRRPAPGLRRPPRYAAPTAHRSPGQCPGPLPRARRRVAKHRRRAVSPLRSRSRRQHRR